MRTDPARFDAVEAHPEYASAPSDPVLPADATIGVATALGPLVMSLVGAAVLLIAITVLLMIRLPPLPWLVLLAIAIGATLLFAGKQIARYFLAVTNAPIERMTAVLVKERTEISGRNAARGTRYYATLQTRDGTCVEYRMARALVGNVVVDDIGIAYIKDIVFEVGFFTVRSKSLVEFIRFEVDN